MVENAPIQTLQHNGLTIEGYSRAAVQTYWRIPELKLGFDLGAQPWDFMGTPTWFVSHTHLDHIAALPVYIARRRMMKMDPPVIYLPDSAVDEAWNMLQCFRRLDRGAMDSAVYDDDGEMIDMKKEFNIFFQGDTGETDSIPDLSASERWPIIILIAALLAVGFFPGIFVDIIQPAFTAFHGSK